VSDRESAYIPYLAGPITQPAPEDGKSHLWAQKGFRFHDLLDAINPLQHLPGISTVYRWITGDSIGNIPRIVGDALYGGIPGFISGLFGVLLKEETGKDVGEHVVATLFGGSGSEPAPPSQSAQEPGLPIEAAAAPGAIPADASPAAEVAATTVPAAVSTPAAPTATAPVATAPALPDRPPMPLAHGVGMSIAARRSLPVAAATPASGDAVSAAFLAQAGERQRQLLGSTAPQASNGRALNPRPVPLQLPPGSIAFMSRPMATLATAPTGAPAIAVPAAGGPVDISRKMLDALDKYVALQSQTATARDSRGAQLNVSP
jgi:hypothetical protein